MNIDVANMGFTLLMTIGFVNVLTLWKPNLDSKVKLIASGIFAFALTFVPPELGNMLADKIKEGLTIALTATGLYKVAQKIGGQ